ncbi:MAG: hypothetical protein AAF692_08915 [Pseudomonadota bacterium]
MTDRLKTLRYGLALAAIGWPALGSAHPPDERHKDTSEIRSDNTFFLEVPAPNASEPEDQDPKQRVFRRLFKKAGPALEHQIGPKWGIITDGLFERRDEITVCLVRGSPADFSRASDFAKNWERPETWFRFSFFDAAGFPRMCRGDLSEPIRISFDLGGRNWSRNGMIDNYKSLQTMNIDLNSIEAKNDFGWVVQHEFGHALGLKHEHQSVDGVCEREIEWEFKAPRVIERRFGIEYDKSVEDQFRILTAKEIEWGPYDKYSIMNYAIPVEMLLDKHIDGLNPPSYHSRVNPPLCNTEPRKEISVGDYEGVRRYYDANPKNVARAQGEYFGEMASAISLSPTLDAREKSTLIALLAADNPALSPEVRSPYKDFSIQYFEYEKSISD